MGNEHEHRYEIIKEYRYMTFYVCRCGKDRPGHDREEKNHE